MYIVLLNIGRGYYDYAHLTDGTTEAQRGKEALKSD